METLTILYLALLVATFGAGWVLGGVVVRRQLQRAGEADYMTGYTDGQNDAYRHQSTTSRA